MNYSVKTKGLLELGEHGGDGNCFSEQLNLKLFRPLTLQMWVVESILAMRGSCLPRERREGDLEEGFVFIFCAGLAEVRAKELESRRGALSLEAQSSCPPSFAGT